MENNKSFLGDVDDLEPEFSRWRNWWGCSFFGQYRLQLGYLKEGKDGLVDVASPFHEHGNSPGFDPWPWRISLLERVERGKYKKWGDYSDPKVAIQALLSLAIIKGEEE